MAETDAAASNQAAMPPPGTGDGALHFSIESFAERDRTSALRDILGRQIARAELEPLSDEVQADVTARYIGEMPVMTIDHSPMHVERTRMLLDDGDDGLILHMVAGGCQGAQLGREIVLNPGDAALMSNGDASAFSCFGRTLLLKLAPQELLPLVTDFDSAIMRRIPAQTPALQFLRGYIGVADQVSGTSLELRQLFVSHVYDLVALALGATRDAAEIARTRGVRAARLHSARTFAMRHLGHEGLSAATVGTHLGVSARYVHMLFEGEGPSFSEFVLGARLERAHRMLQEARHAGKSISTIAFSLGFVDLSHFNRSFRRRYDCTPSDVRASRRGAAPQ